MVHTLELTRQVSNHIFNKLNVKRQPQERWNNKLELYYNTTRFKTSDIRRAIHKLFLYRITDSQSLKKYTYIIVRINVSHLIGYAEPRKPIRIKTRDLNRIDRNLIKICESVLHYLEALTDVHIKTSTGYFRVRRIDYAKDIVLKDSAMIDEYIRLLRKGYKVPRMEHGDYKKYPNYYICNNAKIPRNRRAINCYNKTSRIKARGGYTKYNFLRFEVQMGYGQIKRFCDRKQLSNYKAYEESGMVSNLISLSEEVLKEYLDKIEDKHPYYRKRDIVKKVKATNWEKDTKQMVYTYLDEITKPVKSLADIRCRYARSIELLKSLDINPVPLHSKASGTTPWYSLHEHFSKDGEDRKLFKCKKIPVARMRNGN